MQFALTCHSIHEIFESDYLWQRKYLPYIPEIQIYNKKHQHKIYHTLNQIKKTTTKKNPDPFKYTKIYSHLAKSIINYLPAYINVTNLNIYGLGLKKLPDLSSLIKVTTFDCSDNCLTELPELFDFSNLTELHCGGNKLTHLPELFNFKRGIGLINLEILDCRKNKLICLSDLTGLKKVEILFYFRN